MLHADLVERAVFRRLYGLAKLGVYSNFSAIMPTKPVSIHDRLTAFGAQPIGQRDERLSLIGFAPKALRLSNSIEPTPFGLRSARSVGTENCIQASPDAISAPNRRRLISLPVGFHKTI